MHADRPNVFTDAPERRAVVVPNTAARDPQTVCGVTRERVVICQPTELVVLARVDDLRPALPVVVLNDACAAEGIHVVRCRAPNRLLADVGGLGPSVAIEVV